MQKNISKLAQFLWKVLKWIFTYTIFVIYSFFKKMVQSLIRMVQDWKANPVAFRRGLRSFFIPGWGQFKNKQRYKAIPLFAFFLLVLIVELATSRYFKAFTELKDYPILTQEMIEGGSFFQAYRNEGTIVNGYMITKEDIDSEGEYFGQYRKMGDFAFVDNKYTRLDSDNVSAIGDYYQSPYQLGDVTQIGEESPYSLTAADIGPTGDYYQSLFEIGDVGIYILTSQDVAQNGSYFESYRKAGDRISYVVTAKDLLPVGLYFEMYRTIGNIIKHVVKDQDLATGGLYESSGKAVGDIVYETLSATNYDYYSGFLIAKDVLGGTLLNAPQVEYRISGDLVWDVNINGYRQLSSANVAEGESYFQSPRQAGDIISSDGIKKPILVTQAMVEDQGILFGSDYSQGMTIPYPLTIEDVSEGGHYYQSYYAYNDSFYVPIDKFDIIPNQVNLRKEEGIYRDELGVQADNISDRIYFFRDYGGRFLKGFWGLFTLGEVPIKVNEQSTWYRGWPIIVTRSSLQMDYPKWVEADNSTSLLTNGVIVLVVTMILLVIFLVNVSDAYHSYKRYENTKIVEDPRKWFRRIRDTYFS